MKYENEKSYETGRDFAAKVDYYVEEKRGKFTCGCDISDTYYESDQYKTQKDALLEMLGYLEGLEEDLKAKIESIRKELEDEK